MPVSSFREDTVVMQLGSPVLGPRGEVPRDPAQADQKLGVVDEIAYCSLILIFADCLRGGSER